MSKLESFSFGVNTIRIVLIDGEPQWVAKDVAEGLGYKWKTNLVNHVPEEWRGANRISTLGGEQEMVTLTEQGLYFFLNRSDKPAAFPFQKWVAGDVLPAIRKTGVYSVQTPKPMSQIEMILASAQVLADQEHKIATLATSHATLAAKVEAMQVMTIEARRDLECLPGPSAEVPVISTRALINRVVRDYCLANGYEFRAAWNRLFMEFRDRHHVDLKARAENVSKKVGALGIAEELDMIEEVYSLSLYLFNQGKVA